MAPKLLLMILLVKLFLLTPVPLTLVLPTLVPLTLVPLTLVLPTLAPLNNRHYPRL
ncbi:MAG: hypothetical protein AAFP07_13405 [Cyanobacteria bacterium J06606_4]